jgi:hypothetical protein
MERIVGFRVSIGGEPHSEWLPPGAGVPLPMPIREVELDLMIESQDGGGGFLLIYRSRDGSVQGDTWHETVADAREQAHAWFDVSPDAWRHVSDGEAGL